MNYRVGQNLQKHHLTCQQIPTKAKQNTSKQRIFFGINADLITGNYRSNYILLLCFLYFQPNGNFEIMFKGNNDLQLLISLTCHFITYTCYTCSVSTRTNICGENGNLHHRSV